MTTVRSEDLHDVSLTPTFHVGQRVYDRSTDMSGHISKVMVWYEIKGETRLDWVKWNADEGDLEPMPEPELTEEQAWAQITRIFSTAARKARSNGHIVGSTEYRRLRAEAYQTLGTAHVTISGERKPGVREAIRTIATTVGDAAGVSFVE